ncbi:guanylate kinase [bacterium]|nr:guanylate kinase [bacterium]
MWNKGELIIITAPSGAGKTTLIKRFLGESKSSLSVSYTTRTPRNYEIDGVDYHFISKELFLKKIEDNDFAEWAEVHGNYYGTDKKESRKLINSGYNVIFDVDYQGALNLQKVFPEATSIFILPPSLDILKERLTNRKTDSQESINIRINNAKKEISYISYFDFVLVNNDLEEAYKNFVKIIEVSAYHIKKHHSDLDSFITEFMGK